MKLRPDNNASPASWPGTNHVGQPLTWDSVNFSSAALASAALTLFVASILVPCMEIAEFGNERSLSLLGGIQSLWDSGHAALGIVVFIFTIVFPPLKLIATILVAAPVSFLSNASRSMLRKWIAHLGKWSLLDVFVIAILIVALKVQGFVSVHAVCGTYLFAATVLLSMLAGHILQADPETTNYLITRMSLKRLAKTTATVKGRSGPLFSIGLVLAILGLGLIVFSASSSIAEIRVSKKDGLIDFSNLFGNPSLYIVVRTLEGPQRLDTKISMPIGGGLVWYLPQPVPVSQTIRVEVWNTGLLHDRLMDQVETNHRHTTGQRFHFEFVRRKSISRILGICIVIGGFFFSAAMLFYDFAVRKRAAN